MEAGEIETDISDSKEEVIFLPIHILIFSITSGRNSTITPKDLYMYT